MSAFDKDKHVRPMLEKKLLERARAAWEKRKGKAATKDAPFLSALVEDWIRGGDTQEDAAADNAERIAVLEEKVDSLQAEAPSNRLLIDTLQGIGGAVQHLLVAKAQTQIEHWGNTESTQSQKATVDTKGTQKDREHKGNAKGTLKQEENKKFKSIDWKRKAEDKKEASLRILLFLEKNSTDENPWVKISNRELSEQIMSSAKTTIRALNYLEKEKDIEKKRGKPVSYRLMMKNKISFS